MHGNSYWVVGRGKVNFDPEVDPQNYNLDNPLLRDTVILWPNEWVAIRFVANNPGTWYYHCHVLAHHLMGMSTTIVTDPDQVGLQSQSVAFCDQQGLGSDTALEFQKDFIQCSGQNGTSNETTNDNEVKVHLV
jgi:Multicopper oxidase